MICFAGLRSPFLHRRVALSVLRLGDRAPITFAFVK